MQNNDDPTPAVQGVDTTNEVVEESTDSHDTNVVATPEVHTETKSERSTSVATNTGDSSVSVKIDNNSIQVSTSGGDGGSISLSEFQYPGAIVRESSSTRLVLESNDSAESVTDWYQGKIEERGMSAKSFVKTNSNGTILNKLAGGGGGSVSIEISAQEGTNPTKIVINTP